MAGGVPLSEDTYEPDPSFKPPTPEETERLYAQWGKEKEARFAAWAETQRLSGKDDSREAFNE